MPSLDFNLLDSAFFSRSPLAQRTFKNREKTHGMLVQKARYTANYTAASSGEVPLQKEFKDPFINFATHVFLATAM